MRDKVAGQLHLKDVSKVTVSQLIAFLRELERQPKTKGIFPYLAIKAQDNAKVGFFRRMSFIAGRREDLCLATRQQMCVLLMLEMLLPLRGLCLLMSTKPITGGFMLSFEERMKLLDAALEAHTPETLLAELSSFLLMGIP